MAAKNTTVVSASDDSEKLAHIVAMLKASRGTKTQSTIVERISDAAADSGRALSRIGAGFAAATENAALSFQAERDRQTLRTAKFLLANS